MKLILTQEVTGLGAPGDVVDVKDGYARNYLVPRGLATGWTKGGEKQVASIRAARASRELASLDEAKVVKQRLESNPVKLQVRTGTGGRLFGSVTPSLVASAVKDATGTSIDHRKVEIGNAIRSTGEYTVQVRLHPEVSASIDVQVVPEA
ncbi:large subunit ribosomal protein L9 [Quadrisphaera granulorum]|uniref:Large ribosomal subunit protein bL9 n=1 Tax=Quadrisphaera granulorum TaxID=317664 RepID=A0A316AZW1_9ACTN|nr:50S ribosomal protein L9 [Quadrisphaera granulorum]PWJ55787.1 large subunit ribosomal protein L9 [Quadrisphaera granulorum]SZE95284.1 large subunit ribosomal protein L9 [Quadrisphaera granulorum]